MCESLLEKKNRCKIIHISVLEKCKTIVQKCQIYSYYTGKGMFATHVLYRNGHQSIPTNLKILELAPTAIKNFGHTIQL